MTEVVLGIIVEPNSTSVPIYMYVPIPPGGTIRQALLKRSNVDYDVEWGDVTGGDSTISLIAGETLSALKVVYEYNGLAHILSSDDDLEIVETISGITVTSATLGNPVTIVRSGYVEDSGWSWTQGSIYLGLNGALTQVPPISGVNLVIGSAVSPTKVLVDFKIPIFLQE